MGVSSEIMFIHDDFNNEWMNLRRQLWWWLWWCNGISVAAAAESQRRDDRTEPNMHDWICECVHKLLKKRIKSKFYANAGWKFIFNLVYEFMKSSFERTLFKLAFAVHTKYTRTLWTRKCALRQHASRICMLSADSADSKTMPSVPFSERLTVVDRLTGLHEKVILCLNPGT